MGLLILSYHVHVCTDHALGDLKKSNYTQLLLVYIYIQTEEFKLSNLFLQLFLTVHLTSDTVFEPGNPKQMVRKGSKPLLATLALWWHIEEV